MLDAVGVGSVDDLFADIPASVRARPWEVPPPLVEQEVRAELARLAGRNRIPEVSFLGAGVYRHLVPSVVGEVIGRPEFATSYTPYQPEVSQGTLQSIYEFQSLICELTGMEVATASHYDGATATAEAALMACRLTRRNARRRLGRRQPRLPARARDVLLRAGHRGRDRPGRPRRGRQRHHRSGRRRATRSATTSPASSPRSRTSSASSSRWRELAEAAHAAGAQFVAVVEPTSLALLEAAGRLRRRHRRRRGAAARHPGQLRRAVRRA